MSRTFPLDSSFARLFADTTWSFDGSHFNVDELGRVWTTSRCGQIGVAAPEPDGSYSWEATPFLRFANFGGIWTFYIDRKYKGVFWFGALYVIRRYEMNRQQHKHRAELESMAANKLKELDKLKSDFFANISHEFRTPLTLILGPAEQLMERMPVTIKRSCRLSAEVEATSMDREFLERVVMVIEANLGEEEFSVEALASETAMSVSQFNRKLNALIDQPAGQMIRSMRLQRAADLLASKSGNVAEVCYATGFNDQANFTRGFKKAVRLLAFGVPKDARGINIIPPVIFFEINRYEINQRRCLTNLEFVPSR